MSQYTDDTLRYCLQDGTPLESVIGDSQEGVWRPTEEETVVAERRAPHAPQIVPIRRDPESSGEAVVSSRKSRTGLIVLATALGTLLLFGLLAAGFWIMSRGGRRETAKNTLNVNVAAAPVPQKPSPTPTPAPTPESNSANINAATASPTPDQAALGREVTKAIAGWQEDSESMDIESLAERYGPKVDYYRNTAARREFVLRDKERAFSQYDSVKFDITNMQIRPGSEPDTAVAEFDKAWAFDGENPSEGKVRSRLDLKKVDGDWLIIGERDLKVYK